MGYKRTSSVREPQLERQLLRISYFGFGPEAVLRAVQEQTFGSDSSVYARPVIADMLLCARTKTMPQASGWILCTMTRRKPPNATN